MSALLRRCASASAALALAGCGVAMEPIPASTATTKSAPATTARAAPRKATATPEPGASVAGAVASPPAVAITQRSDATAKGFVFVAPKTVFGAPIIAGQRGGLEILDDQARVRFFKPNAGTPIGDDFQAQKYRGQPVLTYWVGRRVQGYGQGYGVILDNHYRQIATVHAGDGLQADFHEFQLTSKGTALITAYHATTTAQGQKVLEGVLQEIDVATGKVITDWHSLDDVPVSDSYEPTATRTGAGFDYFHINAAAMDDDGNIVISARHTWALYKIQSGTGKLLWTLGGKHSDFQLGPGVQTAWQHHVRAEGGGVYRVFDNGAGDTGAPKLRDYSRAIRIKVDPDAKTATLLSAVRHPDGISAGTQGSVQALENGDLFVGWGSQGRFSEFSPGGALLFDGRVPTHQDSYRAFRFAWTGTPTSPPALGVRRTGDTLALDASWNGSTAVATWQMRTGPSPTEMHVAGHVGWSNLHTSIPLPVRSGTKYVAVDALDADGHLLARSVPHTIPSA